LRRESALLAFAMRHLKGSLTVWMFHYSLREPTADRHIHGRDCAGGLPWCQIAGTHA
jgi:hypothetical protein